MTLRMVRALPDAESILARVPPNDIEAMEGQKSLTWIRAQPLDTLNRAIRAELGREGYIDFWTQHRDQWLQTSIFRPLMQAARRIFGFDDPSGQLKWMGRAWQASTRNLGSIAVEPTDDGVRIHHINLPRSHRTEELVLSTLGAIRGIVLATDHSPSIATDDSLFRSDGRFVFHVRWA